jgi:hypothetical protein
VLPPNAINARCPYRTKGSSVAWTRYISNGVSLTDELSMAASMRVLISWSPGGLRARFVSIDSRQCGKRPSRFVNRFPRSATVRAMQLYSAVARVDHLGPAWLLVDDMAGWDIRKMLDR